MNLRVVAAVSLFLIAAPIARAQTAGTGLAEAAKCEERIAAVRQDILNKYEIALADLQVTLQKAADLEGALAVRGERERLSKEHALSDKDFVGTPKALRALQTQTAGRMQELIAQLVVETVPKLVELKKQLTVAGKLDEALAVRGAIESLQNSHLPLSALEPGAVVGAEALVIAYGGDRVRADKIYRGKKIVVRGSVGAFRQDPADPKVYQVFLAGGSGGGWVQCDFLTGENRIREDKTYNVAMLVITGKDGEAVRLQKGSTIEIRGTCDGWDEVVRLTKCEIAR